MDVATWLRELRLERYQAVFRDNEIDWEILSDLTETDLEKLGLPLGPRKKLLKAIAALGEGAAAACAPTVTAVHSSPPAERRQLTVMFADLVGSTELSRRLDPEDMSQILRTYHGRTSHVIERWGGHVARDLGDGVLAYFGWPQAHEDDAERAVRAGLSLAKVIGELDDGAGGKLAVRVGIATGLVVVGDLIGEGVAREQAVVGDTPNLAARLQGIASPCQTVIADATRRLVGSSFDLDPLGPMRLKGLAGSIDAYAVTGERPVTSRFEAHAGPALLPMVGRDQELALLLERWAQAKAGEGQGALLIGEAGIGKSRITRALLDAVTLQPHMHVRYQCSPYHTDSALWPVVQQLNHAAGLGPDGTDDVVRLDKLEALLARAHDREAAPLLAELLGLDGRARYGPLDLDPQVQRARTLDALVRQLLGLASQQPVLMVLEDAHWIDPTTLELIEQCLDRIAAAPVLMVLTSRPDNQPGLAAHPHVTRLTLNRLSRAGVEAIVTRLSGDRLPTETIAAIIERTDGVPLFVEELTKAVLETGEATIPASLHDSLMSRLDRLPEVKEIAQIAACVGRELRHELLAATAGRPETVLNAALDKLAAAELIFRRGTPPQAIYTFKHALVRDAAYHSLLKSRRQQTHAKIAATLEERFPAIAETEPEVVAHHFAAADHPEQAVRYWQIAARSATARSAYREAVAFFERALGSLDRLPESTDTKRRAVDIRLELRPALGALGAYQRIHERHREARELAWSIDDRQRLARIEADLPMVLYQLGRTRKAIEVGAQAVHFAAEAGDSRALIQATFNFGMAHFFAGQFRRAIEIMLEFVEELKGPLRHERLGSTGTSSCNWLGNIAGAYARLGELDQAIAYGQEAVRIAAETSRPFDMCIASLWLGTAHVVRGEAEPAAANFDRIVRLARENELDFILAWVGLGIGDAYPLLARAHEAVAILNESVKSARRFGLVIAEEWAVLGMCNVHLATGTVEDAVGYGRRALELAQSQELPWCEGVAMRLLGCAYARLGRKHFGDAARFLSGAIEWATSLQARPELAHAYRERGKLFLATDRPAEAEDCFSQALDLYRTMRMAAWLKDTESLRAQVVPHSFG